MVLFFFFFCYFLTEFYEGSSPTPLKHRVFLKADLLEGVDLGRGSLPLTRLLCRDLILLSGRSNSAVGIRARYVPG